MQISVPLKAFHKIWLLGIRVFALVAASYLGLSALAVAAEKESYNDRYCTTCHGTDGRGNEGIEAPRLAGMEEWYLRRQLENFRAGIRGYHPMDTAGIAMRPMAKLTDESITDIVDWVGGWDYEPTEITIEGNAQTGESLYGVCATCHGIDAKGNAAIGAPSLAGQNDWYLATQLINFIAGHRGRHEDDVYGQQMAAMVDTLTDESDVRDVVAYINSLEPR
ncbi:MAG: cytochrome C [Gammaproteobacteria bacterium]|nr:cytochrome C [Gammaproteobacteria bacterium]HBW84329.1 cytochrome C [Gammaproteobacteria bacterium]|tara:strand:+ start:398 stop:1060 length:663 start_codon:yes stop_codon:yes gene_type:complete